MDRRLRDEVLVSWIREGGQLWRTRMVIHTVILFDVPMPDEYAAIAAMRPLNLLVFACHQTMLWPPIRCGCSDTHPPAYSDICFDNTNDDDDDDD